MEKVAYIKSYGSTLDVLYVEDDPSISAEIHPFLEKFFNKVDTAADGAEGLEKYKGQSYALVITDIEMPHLDGIKMSREIKQLDPEQDIVITSAYSDSSYFTEAIKMGIDGYILKPIDYDQLIDILYKTMMRIKAKDEEKEQRRAMEKMLRDKTAKLDDIYKKFDEKVNQKTEEIQQVNNRLYELSGKLSKYFSPQVFDYLSQGSQKAGIASQRKKVTVFFSDIIEFTQTTKELEAEELTSLLNSYLDEMSKIALRYDATIDKFIGDAILVFLGDPVSRGTKEDAVRCIRMATEMRRKLVELNQKWRHEGISKPLQVRMGVATGYCTVGNFGSENKMEYTIIGSIVNLASRLQTAADPDSVLVAEETYLLIKESFRCRKKEMINVKGFNEPIQTYEIVSENKMDIAVEERDGFYLYVDYERSDKDEIIGLLDSVIGRLKR